MRIKEVTAGVKLSENYNSYQMSMTAEIDMKEDPDVVGLQLLSKCVGILQKKTNINLDEVEVETKTETKETDKPEWAKCPKCGKNCKIGFKKDNPNGYYCGACKEAFD